MIRGSMRNLLGATKQRQDNDKDLCELQRRIEVYEAVVDYRALRLTLRWFKARLDVTIDDAIRYYHKEVQS